MANEFKLKSSQEGLNELTEKQAKKVRALYSNVYNELKEAEKSLSTKTNISSVLMEQELKKLRTDVTRAYNEIGKQIEGIINENMEIVAKSVVDDGLKAMKKLDMFISDAYMAVPSDVVKAVSSGQIYSGDWSLNKAIWKDINKTQGDINNIVAKGIAMNKSTLEIAKDLEMYVDPNAKKPWDWGKVYPGAKKKVDYNAQRLARTMVNHSYQQSLIRTSDKNPFVRGIKWNISNSHRVCELCKSRAENDGYGLEIGRAHV